MDEKMGKPLADVLISKHLNMMKPNVEAFHSYTLMKTLIDSYTTSKILKCVAKTMKGTEGMGVIDATEWQYWTLLYVTASRDLRGPSTTWVIGYPTLTPPGCITGT